ncbi:MAG: ornithine carbamoyltransferase [Chthonomonadales bacterium]
MDTLGNLIGTHQPALDAARTLICEDALALRGRSLLSMADLSPIQLEGILQVAGAMETARKTRAHVLRWDYPKSIALIFEKPSLRTRATFELGMQLMGGLAVVLGPQEIGLGTRESVPDAARNLERWFDAVMARVFRHDTVQELHAHARIPVINGLSDREHPCQVLADLYTILRKKGRLKGIRVAWVGDGYNMAHSLLLGCALAGAELHAACPEGYMPNDEIVRQAQALAASTGNPASITVGHDPFAAVAEADVVITDVWTSMGQEEERSRRLAAFRPYQVNRQLLANAKRDAIVLHCLPAHRGEEITDDVLDGPQSVVFDEAENRLYAQQALLALVLGP